MIKSLHKCGFNESKMDFEIIKDFINLNLTPVGGQTPYLKQGCCQPLFSSAAAAAKSLQWSDSVQLIDGTHQAFRPIGFSRLETI